MFLRVELTQLMSSCPHEYPLASVCATIALRIAVSILVGGLAVKIPAYNALSVVQIVSIGISLVTNILSTSIVGIYVWSVSAHFSPATSQSYPNVCLEILIRKYRRFVREMLQRDKTTQVGRVLALLAESGLLYSFFVVSPFEPRM